MCDFSKKFHLGLCLAGAVTAGAYTAGVLDYLFETLELWQIRKDANSKAKNENPTNPLPFRDTPNYDVVIDVITGSSAGGMCAAISTAMLLEGINEEDLLNKKSKLYKAWVELADDEQSDTLQKMLKIDDLKKDGFVSLLNTKMISDLAQEALQNIEHEKLPPYVDPNLDVIFTISNLRGRRFGIAFNNDDNIKRHKMTFHQDFMHFKLNQKSTNDDDFLNLSFSRDEDIQLLRLSAIATGAFPLGLRAQSLKRSFRYFTNKTNDFLGLNQLKERGFTITELEEIPSIYNSLNLDGGIFDNEPFGKAEKILNSKAKKQINQDLEAENTNRAILMIDPFPSPEEQKEYEEKPKIMDIIPQVIKALRSQSSFKKDDLIDSLGEEDYTKFMIFPSKSDPEKIDNVGKNESKAEINDNKEPLCCASLGAFGGFLHKDFRMHDYQLGRRNAQRFLQNHFAMFYKEAEEENNPIHRKWPEEAKNKFLITVKDKKFLPIIPDYHTSEEPRPELGNKYPLSNLKNLEKAIFNRVDAIFEELEKDLTNPSATNELAVVENWFREKKKRSIFRWIKGQGARLITPQIKKNLKQKIVDKIIKIILIDLEKAKLLDEKK